jgi:hypothetical protein
MRYTFVGSIVTFSLTRRTFSAAQPREPHGKALRFAPSRFFDVVWVWRFVQKGATKMATSNGNGKKRKPVFSKKYWPVQVAVFEFRNDERLNHSVELTRTFRRDEDSDWETTPFLTLSDLLPASELLTEAYRVIQARLDEDFQSRREGASEDEKVSAPSF